MNRFPGLFAVWLVFACFGVSAGAQTQTPPLSTQATPPPKTQPPAAAAPASPVIIAPPAAEQQQTAAPKTEQGAVKSEKGKLDPSGVPGKDSTAVGPTYVIGPEDTLYVRVWQQADVSGTVTVGPDGTISLPLIDEVKAAGLTPRQLEEELARRFHKFYVEPVVNIQVLAVRSRTYMILGDGVGRPGIFPLTKPLTVLEALVAGGNFSPFAKKNKIYVLRGTQKFPFNWNEVSKGKKLEQNILIQNGDQIYVPD